MCIILNVNRTSKHYKTLKPTSNCRWALSTCELRRSFREDKGHVIIYWESNVSTSINLIKNNAAGRSCIHHLLTGITRTPHVLPHLLHWRSLFYGAANGSNSCHLVYVPSAFRWARYMPHADCKELLIITMIVKNGSHRYEFPFEGWHDPGAPRTFFRRAFLIEPPPCKR